MMPQLKLTPGKLARGAEDLRGVSENMERQVFARYGIPWSARAEFNIDHLIPLELGGADHVDNLWPQSLSVRPYNVERKKVLTRRLLALIAARQITLAQAQQEMREDWIASFVQRLGMVYLR